jgi:hypothetical protein
VDIKQVSRLLNSIGKSTTFHDGCIKEDVPHSENYYMLEKGSRKWEYGLLIREKENNQYMKKIKEFDTEAEGAKYFFLERLSSYYYSKKVRSFMIDHEELDIGGH